MAVAQERVPAQEPVPAQVPAPEQVPGPERVPGPELVKGSESVLPGSIPRLILRIRQVPRWRPKLKRLRETLGVSLTSIDALLGL